MTDLLSLTKIGNIKIGKVISGNPLALEKMLVTRATKENAENFQTYPGFNKEGEESLTVTLPFNSIGLNFEINYITFMEVDKVEYIAKSPEIGKDILLYPLNPEDFNKNIINFGKLTQKMIEDYEFKFTGFLKVMIPEISNFGEVFYFKTGSINTIRAIKDQLTITKTLLKGRLAKIPLELKPVKKDLADGNQIVFLSIGIDDKTIYQYFKRTKELDDAFDFEALDELYFENRKTEEDNIVKIDKKSKINLLKVKTKEVIDIESESDKISGAFEKAEITDNVEIEMIKKYLKDNPLQVLISYLKYLRGEDESTYLEAFEKDMKDGLKPYEMIQKISK